MNEYSYSDLRTAALNAYGTPDEPRAAEALADWMGRYDPAEWNGECYDIDDGYTLRPVYDFPASEDEDPAILRWEVCR